MKRGKRYRALENLIDKNKLYSPQEAISLVKKMGNTKFDETVELSVKLGVDPKRSDHQVRGSTPLPHGTGKKVRILAIAEGEAAKEAKEAGADFVGGKEMIKKIEEGWLDFDAVVAHPSFMRELGKVGKILGPRGLMPSPKTGTVSEKLAPVIKELKAGRVDFKMDKGGNLHIPIGKVSFDEKALEENLITVVRAILRAKPASSKGAYLQKVYLSTTMSPSIK
ncbi:MAG TPA: 50S ribosomal protein L1, partial [bacterium]|nr:50S ribosomal protein L1 [bacterium]HEX68414.1 50S ribosomal protein L1 [bacterium]